MNSKYITESAWLVPCIIILYLVACSYHSDHLYNHLFLNLVSKCIVTHLGVEGSVLLSIKLMSQIATI